MTRPQQPFLVNLFYFIISKTDMQPDGIGQLYDFLYSAFSEFWMSYHIIYLEFHFAMFGTLIGPFPTVGVPDRNCLVMDRVFQSCVHNRASGGFLQSCNRA